MTSYAFVTSSLRLKYFYVQFKKKTSTCAKFGPPKLRLLMIEKTLLSIKVIVYIHTVFQLIALKA